MGTAIAAAEGLLKCLRDCVHDRLEDGGTLQEIHVALSQVRHEVSDTLLLHAVWEAGDHG